MTPEDPLRQSTDYRRALYARYVSDFKGVREGDGSGASWRKWADRRYAPFLANLPRSSSVIELGCGHGSMLDYLRSIGFENLQGIDISAQQVARAAARGCNVRVADVFEVLETSKDSYDLIVAMDFFEHFSKDELHRLFALVRRSLKPEGHLFLQTPNGEGLFPRQVIYSDLTHLTVFTPSSLEQLLRIHGFEAFAFRETGPVMKNMVGVIRVAVWALLRLLANIARAAETGKGQRIWTENMICFCSRTAESQGRDDGADLGDCSTRAET